MSASKHPTRDVRLPAGTIRFRDEGSGPPIVFVHGVFVNGHLWRHVTERLRDRYRCIAPDWPLGSHRHPMSADADLSTPGIARLVVDFIEALGLDDVTLVGNDTGGAVCQLVAAHHGERISRLVLTSCDAFEVFPPPPFGFLRHIPKIPGAAYLLARSMRLGFVRDLPLGYGWVMHEPPREITDGYTQPLLDPAIRRDAVKVLRGITNEHTIQAARHLRDFDRPVLLAWGAEDRLFPLELAERLVAVLPSARLEVVDGARTFIPEDRPDALAELIADFIAAERSH